MKPDEPRATAPRREALKGMSVREPKSTVRRTAGRGRMGMKAETRVSADRARRGRRVLTLIPRGMRCTPQEVPAEPRRASSTARTLFVLVCGGRFLTKRSGVHTTRRKVEPTLTGGGAPVGGVANHLLANTNPHANYNLSSEHNRLFRDPPRSRLRSALHACMQATILAHGGVSPSHLVRERSSACRSREGASRVLLEVAIWPRELHVFSSRFGSPHVGGTTCPPQGCARRSPPW